MTTSVRTVTLAPPRRAPRDLPNLSALWAGVSLPAGVPMLHRPRTLAACIEPFLFWLAGVRGRRPLTIAAYRRDLTCFARFCQEAGIEDPSGIRHQHIEFYLAWLQQAGGRSAQTAARRLSTLKTFFRYLVREETISRDSAAVSFGPKTSRALPVYLTTAEQERALATLARDRTLSGRHTHAVIATLLLTGLRVGELVDLDLGQLNLEAGTLRVVQGKGGKDRELPVVPRLGAILRTYLAEVRPALHQAATSAAVFLALNGRGKRIRGGRLERRSIYRLVAHQLGVIVGRKLSPHKLRHSFASRLREAGGDFEPDLTPPPDAPRIPRRRRDAEVGPVRRHWRPDPARPRAPRAPPDRPGPEVRPRADDHRAGRAGGLDAPPGPLAADRRAGRGQRGLAGGGRRR